MSTGSFCSRRPVVLDPKPVFNSYRNEWGVLTQYGSQAPEVQLNRWYSSAKTSNFKRIKSRDLPVNNFQAGARIRYDSGGTVTQSIKVNINGVDQWRNREWKGTARWAFPTMYDVFGNHALTFNSLPTRQRAEQAALTKVKNTKINVAQAFAERKQTANLLINSVNRFVVFATLCRKGKFADAQKALGWRLRYFDDKRFPKDAYRKPTRDDFASFWLEYSYGWRPLLSDVYGAAELLAQQFTQSRPTYVTATAKTVEPMSVPIYTAYGISAAAGGMVNCTAKCKVGFDVDSQSRDLLKSTGITNPLLLAWELLPYSFVVDWFIPVGNYLSNLDAAVGLQFVRGATSVKTDIWLKSSVASNTFYDYKGLESMSVLEKTIILDRYKLTAFPTSVPPKFSWGFADNISYAVSGIALLNQAFKR